MKKYLSILAVVAMASSAFAQGTVAFANNAQSLVTAGGAAIPANGGFAQLLWAPAGTASTPYAQGNPTEWFAANPGWAAATAAQGGIDAIGPVAGRFTGNTVTVPTATPGATIQAIVAGWTGNYADLNAAYGAGIGVSSIGFSAPFSVVTGNPTTVPPGTAAGITGAGQFGGLNALPTVGIPEPSTLALAGLGVAALLVLRRRS
jgi:hypothetical protein